MDLSVDFYILPNLRQTNSSFSETAVVFFKILRKIDQQICVQNGKLIGNLYNSSLEIAQPHQQVDLILKLIVS